MTAEWAQMQFEIWARKTFYEGSGLNVSEMLQLQKKKLIEGFLYRLRKLRIEKAHIIHYPKTKESKVYILWDSIFEIIEEYEEMLK